MSKPPPQRHDDTAPLTQNLGAASGPLHKHKQPPGVLASLIRLTVLVIIGMLLVLPFTPFAGKIKQAIKEIVAARSAPPKVITKERTVERRVEVPREVIKEVVREVQVEAPPPPLPSSYIPRKDVDVATLYNGITIKTKLQTEEGTFASLERKDAEAFKAEFQLSIRVPKANQSLAELSRINPLLPALLPELGTLLETAKVSGFYHKLYENKTAAVQRDLTRLNKILDRHNFFDCETILELTHPASKRKALLVQSEMDVVADGSDGDRMGTLEEYIYLSDYYQPFTSYVWPKQTQTPNPLLSKWEERLKKAREQFAVKGLTAERNRELKNLIDTLEREITGMKNHSSLIADKDPFIVLSLLFRSYAGAGGFAPQMGDYAVVIHGGKVFPAICGDYGPSFKMGEASLFLAKAVNPRATPYVRPESDLEVTYIIFPGTAEKPNKAPDLAHWYERCGAFLQELGGLGAGHTLHRWEDPFKKEEPPTPAGPLGGVAPAAAGGAAPAAPGGTAPASPASPAAASAPAPAPGAPGPAPSGTGTGTASPAPAAAPSATPPPVTSPPAPAPAGR